MAVAERNMHLGVLDIGRCRNIGNQLGARYPVAIHSLLLVILERPLMEVGTSGPLIMDAPKTGTFAGSWDEISDQVCKAISSLVPHS